MTRNYTADTTFNRLDSLGEGEYENCIFADCNFENLDFSEFIFTDCRFETCNLSLAKIHLTVFRDAVFRNCKMLGLHFDTCNDFGLSFSFTGCQLNHSSFYSLKMKKTVFRNCQMHEIDFTDANLSAAIFDNCDLLLAAFDHTNLEKTDFRTSFNFSIDPDINRMKKAKFTLSGLPGLLNKFDIDIED